jgi:hypothetical protein
MHGVNILRFRRVGRSPVSLAARSDDLGHLISLWQASCDAAGIYLQWRGRRCFADSDKPTDLTSWRSLLSGSLLGIPRRVLRLDDRFYPYVAYTGIKRVGLVPRAAYLSSSPSLSDYLLNHTARSHNCLGFEEHRYQVFRYSAVLTGTGHDVKARRQDLDMGTQAVVEIEAPRGRCTHRHGPQSLHTSLDDTIRTRAICRSS